MTEGQPFIGREIERKLLDTLARRAFDGGGSVVLISGEAGIGKSTLVQAALAESGLAVRNGRARRDDEDGWAEALPADALAWLSCGLGRYAIAERLRKPNQAPSWALERCGSRSREPLPSEPTAGNGTSSFASHLASSRRTARCSNASSTA
jgi:hypothetical protein